MPDRVRYQGVSLRKGDAEKAAKTTGNLQPGVNLLQTDSHDLFLRLFSVGTFLFEGILESVFIE